MKKAIVIGLDGLEPKIVESLLAAGELPHFARLRGQGGYSCVRTTYPAQTPVAWSTFATGTNPGGHGIFDFLRRDPKTYLPELPFTRYERKNAFLPPKAVNLRRGEAIWNVLTRAGITSTVIRMPCSYPPDEVQGRMLSGMGVPDLRGGFGTSTFYTSAPEIAAKESEQVIQLRPESNGSVKTFLIGPRDPKTGKDFQYELTLQLEPDKQRVIVRSDGQPDTLEIRAGQWSDWLKVKFKTGLLQKTSGMVRFYLSCLEPGIEMFASPINYDPESALFPISSPLDYARELERQTGTFYTTGMVEENNALDHGRINEDAFLNQCYGIFNERARMLFYELERLQEGFLFCLFDTPDRMQHMFWSGLTSPEAQGTKEQHRRFRIIADYYRKCDEIVGEAMRYADDETLFIVLSDHGMNSFERGFNVNTWLYEQGLLVLQGGITPGDNTGDMLRAVDWSRTKAYALGLSGIYLNLTGREAQGIVETSEAPRFKMKIAAALTGLGDPLQNTEAIRSVLMREEVYDGPYVCEAPDLVVNFASGYRVSWDTSLGGIPAQQFEDNTRKWCGDHLIDPLLVPGVLLMNRPFCGEQARMIDLAPTILAALNVPRGQNMEGKSLLR